MNRRIPSTEELRARMLARIAGLRRVLEEVAQQPLQEEQRAEHARILHELEALERRTREILGEGGEA